MKDFTRDYYNLINKINYNENFALTRWGDGEMSIINDKYINLLNKGNGEFIYDNKNPKHKHYSEKLKKSFKYKDVNYYVGISCKCCVGEDNYLKMKKDSTQNEENLTWANIFVNSNYKLTETILIPSLKNKDVIVIYNKNGNLDNIPFKIKKSFTVGKNAWIDNYHLINEIIYYINKEKIENFIFLIAAGPLANIMVYELWLNNKNNTYIDIGSVLDKYLKLKLTRGYQLGSNTINKKCIW